jgi:predicted molibdopterin-dependent oxidoreductase YjgC
VNGYWLCDTGRYGYHWINSEDRLRAPLTRHGEDMDPIRTAAALEQAAAGLRRIKEAGGSEAIAGIGSARCTNEENWLTKKLVAEVLGSPHLDFVGAHGDVSAMEDQVLLRKDRNPNSRGCQDIGMAPKAGGRDLDGILKGVEEGAIKALVVLAVGHKVPDNMRKRIANALKKVEFGVLIDCMKTEMSAQANLVLAQLAYAETHGTFTNYAGRIQRLMPGVPQKGEAKPGWELLRDLLVKLGSTTKYPNSWAITKEILDAPAYKGLELKDIGPQGAQATAGGVSK